jgi:hypothetical protein
MKNRQRSTQLIALICSSAMITAGCSADTTAGNNHATSSTSGAVATTETPSTSIEVEEIALPMLDGPLVPMAVIGIDRTDKLKALTAPGASDGVVGRIPSYSLNVGMSSTEQQVADGSTWVHVGSPQLGETGGWVRSEFLVEIEGEVAQYDDFYKSFGFVRDTLSQTLVAPSFAMADMARTVRMSDDASFTEDDLEFVAGNDLNAELVDSFLTNLGASKALGQTQRVSINQQIELGNADSNAAEFFPGSTIVELHYGGNSDSADANWETVILVFDIFESNVTDIVDGKPELIGLAYDSAAS